MNVAVDRPAARLAVRAPTGLAGIVVAGALLVLGLSLLARVLGAELRRDEHLFLAVTLLADRWDIYRDLGFNHLPNLPLFAGPLIRWADEPFLMARLLIFAIWVATGLVMAAHAWRATRNPWIVGLSLLMLATSPLLINATGTLFSNNLLPVPFALGGTLAFFASLDRARPSAPLLLLSGVLLALAAGFKANYAFVILPFAVTAFLLPARMSLPERIRLVVVPLFLGGVIGGLPSLVYLFRDPTGFLVHVLGYHLGPHTAYAREVGGLVMSLPQRAMLARELWGSGGTLLLLFVVAVLGTMMAGRGWRPGWKVKIAASLLLLATILSFVPKPAFPQYYSLPIPFLVLLLILMLGERSQLEKRGSMPLLLGLGLIVLLVDGPRLLGSLPTLARPQQWGTSQAFHISRQAKEAAGGGPIATLGPAYALAAGGRIYPELAGGPFIYRVAHLFPPEQLPHYRLVSPRTLPVLLDSDPPGAILVGADGALDDEFRRYAEENGYRAVPLTGADTPYGKLELFARAGR